MNLVADEGVDAPIVHRLRASGHTVWYVAETSPNAADEFVLRIAVEQQAVLITADKDFGALVFQQHRTSSGVILLRLAGLSAVEKAHLVDDTINRHENELVGAFAVITPRRVRIRPSPWNS